jgi:hypothetical protein
MIRLRPLLAAAALACAAFASLPAEAASIVMCRGVAAGTASGPARWVAPASGTAYSLDNQGCAVIALADIGDAAAGGLTQSGPVRAIVYNTGISTGTTDIVIGTLPASSYVHNIIVSNSVAAAVTGGIAFGTTANGTDIVTALASATPVHAAAVTAWNSTNCTITILYSFY